MVTPRARPPGCPGGAPELAGSAHLAGPLRETPAPSAAPSASLSAINERNKGTVVAHLRDRAGALSGTVGRASDKGDLWVEMACTGAGEFRAAWNVGSKAAGGSTVHGRCDGKPLFFDDTTAGPGKVTADIRPDTGQRWSLLITRRPFSR